MASQINASNSGFGGIVSTGDSSGVLELQAAGTTIATIQSTGMAVTGTLSSSGVSTFAAGTAALPAITTTGDTNTGMFFPAADTIAFAEGGTEAMRLNSSGYVGLGTTTPSAKIHVVGSGLTGYVILQGSDANQWITLGGNFNEPVIGYTSTGALRFGTTTDTVFGGFTERMRIDTSGNLTISGATATKASGTTWANPSDIRLKDNVQDFTKGLTELLQVNVKTWEYNGKGGTVEGTKGIGVIADEIQTILPETVDTYKAKLNTNDADDTDIKRFDATEITWLLVNAIQEQQTIINDLKARIETLETK